MAPKVGRDPRLSPGGYRRTSWKDCPCSPQTCDNRGPPKPLLQLPGKATLLKLILFQLALPGQKDDLFATRRQ